MTDLIPETRSVVWFIRSKNNLDRSEIFFFNKEQKQMQETVKVLVLWPKPLMGPCIDLFLLMST